MASKITAILTILLIPIALSKSPMAIVHAENLGSGTFTGTGVGMEATTAANGTVITYYTDKVVFK